MQVRAAERKAEEEHVAAEKAAADVRAGHVGLNVGTHLEQCVERPRLRDTFQVSLFDFAFSRCTRLECGLPEYVDKWSGSKTLLNEAPSNVLKTRL